MNTLNQISKILDHISNYYVKLKGQNNLLNFLKKEIQFIDEGLNLIDLTILGLSPYYIENCRQIVREALKQNNFLEITRKQNMEIKGKLKKYIEMTDWERNIYDCFILFFPIEIESQDLQIEMFIDDLLSCSVKEEDVLVLLNKYFKDIINET